MIVLSRTIRIDWPRIIGNLQRCGMSLQAVADAVDASKAQVVAYADENGTTEPAHWVGSALLVLWSAQTGLPYTDAPTRKVSPSVSQVLRESA
jgi:hypothetical protein